MILNWEQVDSLRSKHGDSFFILDLDHFKKNLTSFKAAFEKHYPSVNIGYSYKTNYTPRLCQIVEEQGEFAEVVSEMEFALAKKLNIPGPKIIFNGPYKAATAFKAALLDGATLNLDSLRDLNLLKDVCTSNSNRSFGVVIRCNFELNDDEVSRFGFDVDGSDFRQIISAISGFSNVSLKGLHCHFPDRDLQSYKRRLDKMIKLIEGLFPDTPPEILNIGGGYFSHMPERLQARFDTPPPSFEDYGQLVGETLFKSFDVNGAHPTLFLEPGTALVADTQKFYTRVISTKKIRNKRFATVAGSSFDISPTARSRDLPVSLIPQKASLVEKHAYDVVGYTCIEKDILSEGINAAIKVDDFLCYENVGSYSVVMRPPFILPANPVLSYINDGFEVVKTRQDMDQVFQNFVF